MVQLLNQLGQNAEKGQLSLGKTFNAITCRIDPASVATFAPGTAVKLIDSTSNEILVDKASETDEILGFISYQIKNNAPVAEDRVEIIMDNSFMIMEAAAAIAVGDSLEIVSASDKVTPSLGVNKIIGIAMNKATADGDLIVVLIKTPLRNQV